MHGRGSRHMCGAACLIAIPSSHLCLLVYSSSYSEGKGDKQSRARLLLVLPAQSTIAPCAAYLHIARLLLVLASWIQIAARVGFYCRVTQFCWASQKKHVADRDLENHIIFLYCILEKVGKLYMALLKPKRVSSTEREKEVKSTLLSL